MSNNSIAHIPAFLEYAQINYPQPYAMSVKAADSCTSDDNTKLGDPSTFENCYTSAVPSTYQLNVCLANGGVSNSCRSCLVGVVSTVISCLNTCGFNGSSMSNPTDPNCRSCLTALASQMQNSGDSLATCGVNPDVSSKVVGDLYPQSQATTTKNARTKSRLVAVVVSALAILSII
jgi:hypothetical protein